MNKIHHLLRTLFLHRFNAGHHFETLRHHYASTLLLYAITEQ